MNYSQSIPAIFFSLLLAALISTSFATIFQCENFTQQRIVELEKVAEKGDSRMALMLSEEEFGAFLRIGGCASFKKGTIDVFAGVVRGLVKRIKEFAENYEEIKQIKFEEIGDGMLKKNGKLAIGCKKLMMGILSEKGEGIRVNIFTFIEAKKTREFEWLGKCEQIAKLQSPELDEMINEDLWAQHLANAPRNGDGQEGNKMRRVVVEGGGPVGLLATFRLFMAGMEVTMVNGREEYTRSQVVLFDANWQAQLRYLLGTKFDKLFGQEYSFGRIWAERALMSLKYMEKAKNANKNAAIELIYGRNIEELEGPKSAEDPNFYAILQKSPNDKIGQRIPLDFFVCAGGASDRMRDKLFGMKPQIRTIARNYGVSRLAKPKDQDAIIFWEAPLIDEFEMGAMKNWIETANFDKIRENIGGFRKKLKKC